MYDAIGNRVSKTDSVAGVTTYVYDNNDRLLTETNGTKITTSTYDNNGNNLTRGDGTSLTTNTWDIENRLIQSVTDANTTIYQYDANGVRVSSQTNGVETRYLVDSNRPHASVVLEYNPSGTAITEYTYGLNLISQERGGVKSFYHADGLGSTRFLTDSLGNVTDSYVYDAYGNTISSSGTTVNNYLYTGEQFDKNLGEYYLRARYYNPSQGRFTGRDPFEGMLDVPLSLNKYGYVHGNPINNTDPTGMFSLSEVNASLQIASIFAAYALYNANANPLRSSAGTGGNIGGSNIGNSASTLTCECNGSAKKAYKNANSTKGNPKKGNCDEYPFFSTEKGGPENYPKIVSLRLVPIEEASPQGSLMNINIKNVGVIPGDGDRKWYGVVLITSMPVSFWRTPDGKLIF